MTCISLQRKAIDEVDEGDMILLDHDDAAHEVADVVYDLDATLGGFVIEFADGTEERVSVDAYVFVEVED